MDRLAELISKLNEQFAQNAGPAQLLGTTHLIEAELSKLSSATSKVLGTTKVSVVMPSSSRIPERNIYQPEPVIEQQQPVFPEKNGSHSIPKKEPNEGWLFDPMTEIPTLAHQKSNKELNETMGSNESSLNDMLKAEIVEVGHLLNDSPVRDLKKAIGINDRFVFISELFRGDETMYERSIKTINGFRIFPEAEYWIERELKVKLGWDDSKPSTRHFYQVVKRRFT
ncbi:MAG: hypothetical protein H7Y31_06380 [Chitinophagaceae bacterium]|nr:hypothetical protein [Chitinophagaceae bacterium]